MIINVIGVTLILIFTACLIVLLSEFRRCKQKPVSLPLFVNSLSQPEGLQIDDPDLNLLMKKIFYLLWMHPDISTVEKLLKDYFKNRNLKFSVVKNSILPLSLFSGLLYLRNHQMVFFIGGIIGLLLFLVAIILEYDLSRFTQKTISEYLNAFIISQKAIYSIEGPPTGILQCTSELSLQLKSVKKTFESFQESLIENNAKLSEHIQQIADQNKENIGKITQTTDNFISQICQTTQQLLESSETIIKHTDDLSEMFGTYEQRLRLNDNQWKMLIDESIKITKNITVFIESIEIAKDVIEKLMKSSMDLSQVSKTLVNNLQKLEELTEKLDKSLLMYESFVRGKIYADSEKN